MDSIMLVFSALAHYLVDKIPALSGYGSVAIAAVLAMGAVIELAEAAFKALKLGKAEETAEKIEAIRVKVLAVLEVIPHTNLPVVATIVAITAKIKKAAAALKGAIDGWNQPKA